jgi:hypothetical protein
MNHPLTVESQFLITADATFHQQGEVEKTQIDGLFDLVEILPQHQMGDCPYSHRNIGIFAKVDSYRYEWLNSGPCWNTGEPGASSVVRQETADGAGCG